MTRQSYATEIRIIRLMCTGRVDLAFVFRALQRGADGVIIGGCWPGECHYVTEGNYDALGNTLLGKKLLGLVGLDPGRLRVEWISASEGARFAEVMSDFADGLRKLGPLGRGEGLEPRDLERKLAVLNRLVPWLKLLEREKLRVSEKSEEAYRAMYGSEATDRLVSGPIADQIAILETVLVLSEGPLTTRELSERLKLSASDVSRHLCDSSRRGLVRYDVEGKRYELAGGRP